MMIQRKKWIGYTVVLVFVVVSVTNAIRARDAEIQSERDISTRLIKDYEQKVKTADNELRALESQTIAFSDLEKISKLQTAILNTSRLLISLAPVIKYPDKVDQSSKASVDTYNKKARSYDDNIGIYQSQMSELNGIVESANKQYVIKIIKPSYLDRASLSTRRKFSEIIGLSQTPDLAPSSQIEQINQGITERSDQQKAIRTRWNTQARKINETNRSVNSQLDEIYKLYKTTKDGVRIERATDVKTVD
jgi:hypothetical protein